jgi:hypothetical protein
VFLQRPTGRSLNKSNRGLSELSSFIDSPQQPFSSGGRRISLRAERSNLALGIASEAVSKLRIGKTSCHTCVPRPPGNACPGGSASTMRGFFPLSRNPVLSFAGVTEQTIVIRRIKLQRDPLPEGQMCRPLVIQLASMYIVSPNYLRAKGERRRHDRGSNTYRYSE